MVTRVPKEPACPFCGSTSSHVSSSTDMGPNYFFFVQCDRCVARGPRCKTLDGAKATWLLGAK